MTYNKNEYMKKYRKTEKGREVARRWWLSDKSKIVSKRWRDSKQGKEYRKKYEATEKRKLMNKRYEQYPNVQEYRKEYRASSHGKDIARKWKKTEKGKKHIARRDRKRRNLDFNPIAENIIDEPIDWHHINDKDVIALPTDIHELFNHYSTEIHRENLKPIIDQLYGVF
jgi:hypothetical protein